CTITWYDGGYMPDATDWPMPEGKGIPGQGSMFLGEKGAMLLAHIGPPILLPLKDFRGYPSPGLPSENHYHQWVNACLGEGKASADFDYSGPLSETLLLGVLACRFPNQELKWDAAKLRFTNNNDANKLLKRQYRRGHEVRGLS